MENLQREVSTVNNSIHNAGSAATSLIITNIVLLASVILMFLNQVLQGHSYSHFIFSLSTIIFIVLIGISTILLLGAVSATNEVKTDPGRKEIFEKLRKAGSITKRSLMVTSFSVIFYALVVSFIFLF